MKTYLAIDIGASSGRHIVAYRENGEMVMKEVFRFKNGPVEKDGVLTWDIDNLLKNCVEGIKKAKEEGFEPVSVGIDTWGVDYMLFDETGELMYPLFCYRDDRGRRGAEEVHKILPFEKLYSKTGMQFQPFNTIYQMYSDKQAGRLDKASDFLLVPELIGFYLSGKKAHEYTNCSTTGLLDANTRKWDKDIIKALGLNEALFNKEPEDGPIDLGPLKKELAEYVGYAPKIILPATHDTGSAVASLRETKPEKAVYISSGTWSLMGVELQKPITTKEALAANLTNEGGLGTIRFLKNIMGLWLVQCLKAELKDEYDFATLAEMAREAEGFDYALEVNDDRYLAPKSVMETIKGECEEKGYPIPATPGDFAYAIYNSLAHAYSETIKEIEGITKEKYERICIIGGGSKNTYLNELTARITGYEVVLGSPEATALGNILLQEEKAGA